MTQQVTLTPLRNPADRSVRARLQALHMQTHRVFQQPAGAKPSLPVVTDRVLVTLATRMCAFLAERRLLAVGYREREVRVVEGARVLADLACNRMDVHGRATIVCLDSLAQHPRFWAVDAHHAEAGAAFLLVVCADDAMAQDVARLVRPLRPRSVRRYCASSVH